MADWERRSVVRRVRRAVIVSCLVSVKTGTSCADHLLLQILLLAFACANRNDQTHRVWIR